MDNLDTYLENYKGLKGSIETRFMTKATLKIVSDLCLKKTVLNLGLGNGLIAKEVEKISTHQVVVEGSRRVIEQFSSLLQKSELKNSFFEDFYTEETFDVILANHVLEHVNDPIYILKKISKAFLSDNGKIVITVPNAKSLHRKIGVEMGLLKNEYELNKSDLNAGHKRVYDKDQLAEDIKKAGLIVEKQGGYNVKLVSLSQMQNWEDGLLDAIFTVSQQLDPGICANLYAVVGKKN